MSTVAGETYRTVNVERSFSCGTCESLRTYLGRRTTLISQLTHLLIIQGMLDFILFKQLMVTKLNDKIFEFLILQCITHH